MNVYFDNASTTKPCSAATNAANEMMSNVFGNPSSSHILGRQAAKALDNARADIANAIGGKKAEIYFTSGGTESDNWALFSSARHMKHKGKHIISSTVEHDAVRHSLGELSRLGYEVQLLKPDESGSVSAQAVANALRDDTILVSLMLVNNETGAITDINAVSKAIKARRSAALLHTDAVQGFLHIPFSAKNLGADMISVSAHKVHGLKGSGALWIKSGLKLPPYIWGGGQENALRSGTEAMPQIAAFAAAAKEAANELDNSISSLRELKGQIISELKEKLPETHIICPEGASHILCLSVPGCRSEVLLNYLDFHGICVSKGSACKRGARSHVLSELLLPANIIDGAIRLSFSRFNTAEEGSYFVSTLVEAANTLFLKR